MYLFTLSNILKYLGNRRVDRNQILSEASFGSGKGCIIFKPDRIRILVSMATDSSHKVMIKKVFVETLVPTLLVGSS